MKWSYQKYNHHEAVKNREPVNAMLEEIWIQVFVKSVLKDVKVKVFNSLCLVNSSLVFNSLQTLNWISSMSLHMRKPTAPRASAWSSPRW